MEDGKLRITVIADKKLPNGDIIKKQEIHGDIEDAEFKLNSDNRNLFEKFFYQMIYPGKNGTMSYLDFLRMFVIKNILEWDDKHDNYLVSKPDNMLCGRRIKRQAMKLHNTLCQFECNQQQSIKTIHDLFEQWEKAKLLMDNIERGLDEIVDLHSKQINKYVNMDALNAYAISGLPIYHNDMMNQLTSIKVAHSNNAADSKAQCYEGIKCICAYVSAYRSYHTLKYKFIQCIETLSTALVYKIHCDMDKTDSKLKQRAKQMQQNQSNTQRNDYSPPPKKRIRKSQDYSPPSSKQQQYDWIQCFASEYNLLDKDYINQQCSKIHKQNQCKVLKEAIAQNISLRQQITNTIKKIAKTFYDDWQNWTTIDVIAFFEINDISRQTNTNYIELFKQFTRNHDFNGSTLATISESTLNYLGFTNKAEQTILLAEISELIGSTDTNNNNNNNNNNNKQSQSSPRHTGKYDICIGCAQNPANMVFVPCGHVCLCNICTTNNQINKCSHCSQSFQSLCKLYHVGFNDDEKQKEIKETKETKEAKETKETRPPQQSSSSSSSSSSKEKQGDKQWNLTSKQYENWHKCPICNRYDDDDDQQQQCQDTNNWIQCDKCDEWYHAKCIKNVDATKLSKNARFECDVCVGITHNNK